MKIDLVARELAVRLVLMKWEISGGVDSILIPSAPLSSIFALSVFLSSNEGNSAAKNSQTARKSVSLIVSGTLKRISITASTIGGFRKGRCSAIISKLQGSQRRLF